MWKIQVTTVMNPDAYENYEDGFKTQEDAYCHMMLLEESSDLSGFGEGYRVVPE